MARLRAALRRLLLLVSRQAVGLAARLTEPSESAPLRARNRLLEVVLRQHLEAFAELHGVARANVDSGAAVAHVTQIVAQVNRACKRASAVLCLARARQHGEALAARAGGAEADARRLLAAEVAGLFEPVGGEH